MGINTGPTITSDPKLTMSWYIIRKLNKTIKDKLMWKIIHWITN